MRNRNLMSRPTAQGGKTPLRFSHFSGDMQLLSCSCVWRFPEPLFERPW